MGIVSRRAFAPENLDSRLRAGLVGHWIGGGSGYTWFDKSGLNHHGARTNDPQWSLGDENKFASMRFYGVTDYVSVPDAQDLRLAGTPFSISIVVRPRLLKDYGNLIWKANYPTDGFGIITFANGDAQLEVSPSAAAGPALGVGGLVDGKTSCIVVTGDAANNIRWYNNGQLVSTTAAYAYPIISGTHVLEIGGDTQNSRYFDGRVDEVRIYTRELSQAEISLISSPSVGPIISRRFGLAS